VSFPALGAVPPVEVVVVLAAQPDTMVMSNRATSRNAIFFIVKSPP